MATAESSLTSLGPRFAPEDPTLPKPWKGLIDGASGALYYWNPETNVTQYERPAGMAPPLPTGPPPSSTTPKLAPVPVASSLTANGTVTSQPCQQVLQQPGQQIRQLQPSQQLLIQQPGQHMLSQHSHKMPYQQIQIQNQQTQPVPQQQGQPYANMQLQQMPYSQVSYVQGQLMPHPLGQAQQGVQNDSLGSQFHRHHGPQSQTSQTMLQQGQQVHAPQIIHQHGQQPHGLQATMQQGQPSQGLPTISQNLQGQQQPETLTVPQQGQQLLGQPLMQQNSQSIGPLRAEEATHQEVKQGEYPSPLVQHSGALLSNQHAPGIGPSFQIPRSVEMFQSHPQFSGLPSLSAQPSSAASVRLQQEEIDTMPHQQQRIGAPTTMDQMGHASFHPPSGMMKVGYEEDKHRRMAHDVYSSGRNESPMMLQQPNLAPSPLARNQPDMRMGASNTHFSAHENSGGLNTLPSRATPSMYNHAPFPNASPIRPPLRMFGSAEYPSISSVDAYRQHHEVTALGDNIPAPFMTFEATGFPPEILKEMHFAGFSSPTPIQAQTWPVALQGRDIVAIAKTGSGKTLGYLMPAYIHLRRCRNSPQGGPTVLVLSPTRELATQIQEEAIKFGRSSRISCICLYGGSSKGPQLREIERGADIVVATPGRLNDFLEMKKINFHQVSFLVLDEADRMLDMGFEPQIRKIVDEIPPHRQTLMYTATWPKEVRKIAADLLVNPVQVNIGSVDELVANKSITQYVEVVPPMEKQRRLEQILRAQERGSKIIIFCSTKRLCDQLAQSIGRSFGAAAIHGDKSQDERDRVLGHFRSGRAPILVATDVAARGLDIKDIRVVINYDFPTGIEEYIHRIGRTGRAGAMGVAYTFLTDQDWKFAADLVKVLEGANQFVPPVVREMAERGAPVHLRGRGEMGRWDSGGGGRWDSGAGRGVRDGGGSGFGRRGGGRNEFFSGRGGRGRGFGGPVGRGRHDRGPHDRYNNNLDGRGHYDNRRGIVNRNRDRKYSPSLERVRTSRYDRSRSRSVSRSRSRSWSRSRSRSRSWTPSRSRSCSIERFDRPRRRPSMFDVPLAAPVCEAPASSGLDDVPPADPVDAAPAMPAGFDAGQMSPMSPGQDQDTGSFPSRNETADQVLGPSDAAVGANLGQHPVGNM